MKDCEMVSNKRDETAEFDPSAVLETMARETAKTVPIDAAAAREAAAASLEVPDPRAPRSTPAVIRRGDETVPFRTVHQPDEPFAEIGVVGDNDVYALPLRAVSASGLAVAAAAEQAPLLRPGTDVVVHVALEGDPPVELRLEARVEHRREAGRSVEGGIRLKWVGAGDRVVRSISKLVTAWAGRSRGR